jgi:DNA-binding CsgD family transcriptional regulator
MTLVTAQTLPEHVEAAARAERVAEGRQPLARFEAFAAHCGQPWAQAAALRCRALVTPDEKLFTEALGLPQPDLERARTELAFGEWLRRDRRRNDARPRLRAAAEIFGRLGIHPWASRAHNELRAAGDPTAVVTRGPRPLDQLTPQELQVVQLAAAGLSNRDIGAQLFLSHRTVGYHLYKAFPKLQITSRNELLRLSLGG